MALEHLSRGRQLLQDLRARWQADPEGRSALQLAAGVLLLGIGALMAVGDAATLMLGALMAAGLILLGRHLEPAGGRGSLQAARGAGLQGNLHLVTYGIALAIAGYALIQLAVSIALLIGGGLLLRSGWAQRGDRPLQGLVPDLQRLLRDAEGDIKHTLSRTPPPRRQN